VLEAYAARLIEEAANVPAGASQAGTTAKMSGNSNLLVPLHRYASGQDENFTTEAFGHLLRHLARNEPEVACNIIAKLSGDRHRLTIFDLNGLIVRTQQRHEAGISDIELDGPHDFLLIEVKIGSPVWNDQLKRYRQRVEDHRKEGEIKGSLVLLTPAGYSPAEECDVRPDASPTWSGVADWLRGETGKLRPVGKYLVDQFIEFLQFRGLTMEKVDKELELGLRAMMNLLKMLRQVLKGIGVSHLAGASRQQRV
jgi:hypothetical protein